MTQETGSILEHVTLTEQVKTYSVTGMPRLPMQVFGEAGEPVQDVDVSRAVITIRGGEAQYIALYGNSYDQATGELVWASAGADFALSPMYEDVYPPAFGWMLDLVRLAMNGK